MKTRRYNPRRLDVPAFARDQARLEGEWSLSDLVRLSEGLHPRADAAAEPGPVAWAVQGMIRQPAAAQAQIRLQLLAQARVELSCQRCLQPVQAALQVDRVIRFVATEDEAARLDEQGEEDVLACSRAIDLQDLIEDELILALPLVPRHEDCALPEAPHRPDGPAA